MSAPTARPGVELAWAVFRDQRTAYVVLAAGLAVFVAGLAVASMAMLAVGLLVTLAAVIRAGHQAAADQARRTYRYLRCRCTRSSPTTTNATTMGQEAPTMSGERRRPERQPMTDEEFVAWEAEQPLRPVCPDWCVSQWCAVAPQVIGRQVAFWHGWHRSSMWTVPVEYGEVIEVAAGAAEDVVKVAQADGEPIEYQVIMRHLDRQEDGERTTELTLGEAEQLVHALRRSIEDARRHVEFDERRRSSG